MSYHFTPEGKDAQLWQEANKRVSFKTHLASYIVINIFLWLVWAFTGSNEEGFGIPWPAWTTFGWGIGVMFHYLGTYVKTNSVEREYEKLKNLNK